MGDLPDYEPSFDYIEDIYSEDDVLITDLPPISYYFKRPDFTTVNNITGKDLVEDGEECYSDSELLKSPEELNKKINKTDSGWLILDSTFYEGWSYELSKDHNGTEYESDGVKVWNW